MASLMDGRKNQPQVDRVIRRITWMQSGIDRKISLVIDKMLAYGEDYAINAVAHVDTGETLNSIMAYREGLHGVIVAGGNAVWLEFGTGVRYNGAAGTSPHPKGRELGMNIGEYGKGHGADPNGWYYQDENGKWHHTYGIQANMFMYRTAQELKNLYMNFVKGVFK